MAPQRQARAMAWDIQVGDKMLHVAVRSSRRSMGPRGARCEHRLVDLASRANPALGKKGPGGKGLDAIKTKGRQTCWECHHGNNPFEGPIEPFGCLCYYLERSGHTLAPTTVPGLFLGWRLESGMRYRNALKF